MQKIQIFPGFCYNMFNALKIKVAAVPPESMLCVVTFDEMSLKERVTVLSEMRLKVWKILVFTGKLTLLLIMQQCLS